MDYSCMSLSCGGQGAKIDRKLAAQFVLHALAFDCDDPDYLALRGHAEKFCADSHRRKDVAWPAKSEENETE